MAAAEKFGIARPGSAIRVWTPALAMLAISFALLGWLELRPLDDRYVAAVFPPWWAVERSTEAVVAADGAIIGWGGLASVVIARSDRSDFATRLHAAGALVLLEPSGLFACSGNSQNGKETKGKS